MPTEWISRDAVFAALDMNAVLEHYGVEPKRGSSFRINCPFHEDARPSCSINVEAKLYNCFGCGSQGNALDFIAQMDGLDCGAEFRAVLETAITIIGHNPTDQSQKPARRTARKTAAAPKRPANTGVRGTDEDDPADETQTAERSNAKRSRKARSKTHAATKPASPDDAEPNTPLQAPAFPLKLERTHPFLKERGFSQPLLDEFGVGFEPRSNALMAGRICFPIHNGSGELVAYAGRWGSDETDDNGDFLDAKGRVQERYKLPKGFRKSLELYNLHRVLRDYPETDTVVLVEGFWSVLRLHSLTIPTLGLMGLSVSPEQMTLLRCHGFKRIVLMLDGDDEGRAATDVALRELASSFFVKDALLPEGAKPDDVEEDVLTAIAGDFTSPNAKGEPPQPAEAAPLPDGSGSSVDTLSLSASWTVPA